MNNFLLIDVSRITLRSWIIQRQTIDDNDYRRNRDSKKEWKEAGLNWLRIGFSEGFCEYGNASSSLRAENKFYKELSGNKKTSFAVGTTEMGH
jgi:hypothetical protein